MKVEDLINEWREQEEEGQGNFLYWLANKYKDKTQELEELREEASKLFISCSDGHFTLRDEFVGLPIPKSKCPTIVKLLTKEK